MESRGIINKLMSHIKLGAKQANQVTYVQEIGGEFSSQDYGLTTGLPTSEPFFFGPDGLDYKFRWHGKNPPMDAYMRCSPLAAILNRKTQAYLNGRTYFENSQETEVKTGAAGRYLKLLSKPNALQSWKQFEAQQYLYLQMYGWCICLPVYPVGFKGDDPSYASALWNIPPYMVLIEETDKLWYQTNLSGIIAKITLDYKGVKQVLDADNIYIFRDYIPNSTSQVIPSSRLQPLAMNINNIIAAYESRNELINYAGSQGILSPPTDQSGPVPVKSTDRTQLQADFKRQYGIRRGQSRYIITAASLNWTQMGKPTKDLMLFEEIVDDTMQICNSLNYPAPLISTTSGPAVANTEEYKIQLYEDGIIPESQDIYEQWNIFLKTNIYNIKACKDYNHLPVLQGNMVEQSHASLYLNQSMLILWQNDMLTWNEWRLAIGQDTVAGRDYYYTEGISRGLVTPSGALAQNQQSPNNGSQNQTQDENY